MTLEPDLLRTGKPPDHTGQGNQPTTATASLVGMGKLPGTALKLSTHTGTSLSCGNLPSTSLQDLDSLPGLRVLPTAKPLKQGKQQ